MTKGQKRSIAFAAVLAMVLSLLLCLPDSVMTDLGFGITASAATITPSKPSGSGTSSSPYQIRTAAELYWFAGLVNGTLTDGTSQNTSACAKLTADITVNTDVLNGKGTLDGFTSWTPIGNISNQYTGTFDGNGKTINGLFFNDRYAAYVGLFGCIGRGGSVSNVGIVDSCFYGADSIGGISGKNYGAIENCYNVSYVGAPNTNSYNGGVCGNNQGTITNCYNAGTIACPFPFSVCGENRGSITNCYYLNTKASDSKATPKTAEEFASGEVAYLLNGSKSDNPVWYQKIGSDTYPVLDSTHGTVYQLTPCSAKYANSKDITADHTPTGEYDNGFGSCAICGAEVYEPAAYDEEKNCYKISNAGQLYWFAQQINDGNYYLDAILTANITVNTGVLNKNGELNSDTFKSWTPIGNYTNCYSGTFDGQNYTVSGLYFNDATTDYVGLFGYNLGTVKNVGVIDSYFNGKNNVGGVCGYNNDIIENCYNEGNVEVTGTENGAVVGGVCGYNFGTIKNCNNEGNVKGTESFDIVGGVCGNNHSTIQNCYNTGKVSAPNYTGGVCGFNSDGTITNCYNTGTVSITSYSGGVCVFNFATITNCYYLDTEETDSFDGTTAKTTSQFTAGEVAYLLQSGQTEDENGTIPEVWGQTIGTDNSPVIGGAKVFQVNKYDGCKDKPGEESIGYSNTDAPIYAVYQLSPIKEKPETCTEDGYIEHYKCELCGKLFSDENGTTEVTLEEITIAAHHSFGEDWESDKDNHWHICTVCGEKSEAEAHTKDEGTVTKEATITENGTLTYKCKICGAYMDEETITATISSIEVTESNVVVKYTVTGSTEVKSQKYTFDEVTVELVELMKSDNIQLVIDFVNSFTAADTDRILTDAQLKAIEYVLAHDFGVAA